MKLQENFRNYEDYRLYLESLLTSDVEEYKDFNKIYAFVKFKGVNKETGVPEYRALTEEEYNDSMFNKNLF
jgi:hypothetical protein